MSVALAITETAVGRVKSCFEKKTGSSAVASSGRSIYEFSPPPPPLREEMVRTCIVLLHRSVRFKVLWVSPLFTATKGSLTPEI